MIKKKSWQEFRKTGLFLHMNRFLHIFGWAVVCVIEDDEVIEVYPARVKFRGFDEKTESEAFINTSNYMITESCELAEEAES